MAFPLQKQIVDVYLKGNTIRETADLLNCNKSYVGKAVKKAGVSRGDKYRTTITKNKTKVCPKCKREKDKSDFYDSKRTLDGKYGWCKNCKIDGLKNSTLKFRYGLSTVDYNKIFGKQQGCCAVCGIHQSELKKALGVEHNHLTKEIRGLTCPACNWGLGYFRVDEKGIELLQKAINYLRRRK